MVTHNSFENLHKTLVSRCSSPDVTQHSSFKAKKVIRVIFLFFSPLQFYFKSNKDLSTKNKNISTDNTHVHVKFVEVRYVSPTTSDNIGRGN